MADNFEARMKYFTFELSFTFYYWFYAVVFNLRVWIFWDSWRILWDSERKLRFWFLKWDSRINIRTIPCKFGVKLEFGVFKFRVSLKSGRGNKEKKIMGLAIWVSVCLVYSFQSCKTKRIRSVQVVKVQTKRWLLNFRFSVELILMLACSLIGCGAARRTD